VILGKFWSRFDLRQRRNRIFLGDDQGCLSERTIRIRNLIRGTVSGYPWRNNVGFFSSRDKKQFPASLVAHNRLNCERDADGRICMRTKCSTDTMVLNLVKIKSRSANRARAAALTGGCITTSLGSCTAYITEILHSCTLQSG
jgi:hypothetical protein